MGIPLSLSGYALTYDDEFNAFKSSPDGSVGYKTTFYFGGRELYSNGDLQYYSDSTVGVNPFSVANGALSITAAPGTNPDHQPYNSGLITTEGLFSQTFGYFEARVQVAQGPGLWSSFWMLPTSNTWPPEIDVLEAFGASNPSGDGGANQAYHGTIAQDRSQSGGSWAPVNGNIWSGYHTYGVDWEPDFITWYIDGQQVAQVGQLTTPTGTNTPMYMLLNLAVGGWPGNPAGESGVMGVDYIRAYSKDPNAHSVALQTISSPDGATTTPFGASDVNGVIAAPDHIVVRVSEDAWNGDAQFTVMVDGHQLGGVQTVTASHGAGQWQDITLNAALTAGNHAIAINYINDANGGTAATNRNLYVQSVAVDGEVIPGTSAHNTAANGHTDPQAAVMDVNGTATFDATYSTLSLRVSEDAWSGDAKFIVSIDGNQVGGVQTVTASHAAAAWQDINLSGFFSTGAHTIDVSFINDAWGGSTASDRNMYVQSITMNGQTIAGNLADNTAAVGYQSMDPSAAVMVVNGTATFHASGTHPTQPTTLVLHVAEDAWSGDAQFIVKVDGAQVGGVQTATAIHNQNQWQAITLSGDFGSLGPDKVDIQFINDGWGGSTAMDRNLYIQSIDVNGVNFLGSAAANNAANGHPDPNSAFMAINGIVEFNVHHQAPPPEIMG